MASWEIDNTQDVTLVNLACATLSNLEISLGGWGRERGIGGGGEESGEGWRGERKGV